MNTDVLIECIGYLGSVLVVVSMLMTSVKKLRIVNTVGSVIFAGYALIIKSYPTALMNLFLVGINIYNLLKLKKAEKDYRIIECYKDESIVIDYLKTFADDIAKFFPDFENNCIRKLAFLVCSDSRPVGLLIGEMSGESTLSIELDYTIPAYRDCSVGAFMYDYLTSKWEITQFVFNVSSNNHENYLFKMGFEKSENGYIKKAGTV